MTGITLLRDLAVIMIVAGAVTILFHRLRQPVILGYILAGVIIGPYTPPFPLVKDIKNIETLANLGIVILMFSIGLEFNFRKLRQVGFAAGVAAFLGALLMIWLGYGAGRLLGWAKLDSLFLGAMLCVSSSTIIIKTFQSLNKLGEPSSQLALTVTLVEDLVAITVITVMSSVALTGSMAVGDVLGSLTRIAVFIVAAVVLGVLVVPRLITYVARFNDDEVLIVTALGLCFGLAMVAVKLGYSPALGAFIMGAIVSESRDYSRLAPLIAPVRDIFLAVFFVSAGLMIQPKLLVEYAGPALAVAALAIVGRSLILAFANFTVGVDGHRSLRAGLGLTPLGEFSFLIAQIGIASGRVSEFLLPVALAGAAITAMTAPYLVRSSDRLIETFERFAPRPLTTFLGFYSQWVGNLRSSRQSTGLWRFVRRPVIQLAIEVVVITGLFVGASFAVNALREAFPKRVLFEAEVEMVMWLALVLLCLPGFIAMWRNLEAMSMILSDAALSRPLPDRLAPFNVQRLLKNVFLLVGGVLAGLWIVALSSRFLPPWPLLIALAVIAAIILRKQWHSMVLLHSRMETAVREVFTQLPEVKPSQQAEIVDLIKKNYPWNFELSDFVLPRQSASAGRTIRDLALRSRTGASIVGIEREGFRIANPSPGVPLFPGDGLVLIGNREQLQQARLILGQTSQAIAHRGSKDAAIEVTTVAMEPGCALIGKTISESHVRQLTGATIIGIQRGEQRLPNPSGETKIENGDVVLLLGNRQQLDMARALCSR